MKPRGNRQTTDAAIKADIVRKRDKPEPAKPRTSWWIGAPREGWTASAQQQVGGRFASSRVSGENSTLDWPK